MARQCVQLAAARELQQQVMGEVGAGSEEARSRLGMTLECLEQATRAAAVFRQCDHRAAKVWRQAQEVHGGGHRRYQGGFGWG